MTSRVLPAVKSQLAVQSNLQDSTYDCSSARCHCYVTLSGARSTAGEMCRNFPPESELKLFACGGSRNLHTQPAFHTAHLCTSAHFKGDETLEWVLAGAARISGPSGIPGAGVHFKIQPVSEKQCHLSSDDRKGMSAVGKQEIT